MPNIRESKKQLKEAKTVKGNVGRILEARCRDNKKTNII